MRLRSTTTACNDDERMKPTARDDLAIRDLDEEAVVYDFRRHKAHCLNRTALAVFRKCDGTRPPRQIARELTVELGRRVDEAVVLIALAQLDKEQLLSTPLRMRAVDNDRRRLLKKLAVTAGLSVALPAVWSILAPTPAYAASTLSCAPAGGCMGVNNPPSPPCCNNNGMAGTCSGPGTCGGTSSTCAGQTCG
jgi:hypothetical protein